jgi:hypothetical protein
MNMIDKPFFHEAPQEEIDALISGGATWQKVMDNYEQPAWCDYPGALAGEMGCCSLTDISKDGGLRTKISKEFCSTCPCCNEQAILLESSLNPDKPLHP